MADDYNKDYWAPDRAAVLKAQGVTDTSGKAWNGSAWVDGASMLPPGVHYDPGMSGESPVAAPTPGAPATPSGADAWSQYMPGGAGFNSTAPAGFDQTKWADPNKMDPKYEVGRILAGGGSPEQAAQAIGGTYMGKDLIRMADGTVVDVYKDYQGTGQAVQFNPWDMNPGAPGAAGGGGMMTAGGPGGAARSIMGSMGSVGGPGALNMIGGQGFTPSTPVSGWSADPRTNDLYSMLMGRAGQSLDVNANDPIIKNQTNAYQAADTRNMRSYLNNLAEKGGPNANLGSETRMASEKVGQDVGGFQAQLMQHELTARRQEIQDALTQTGQFLSDQQRMELQNQLQIMDNLLGQAGLQQNAYAFDQSNQYRNSPLAL